MQETEKSAGPVCSTSTSEAMRAIANRLIGREEDVARSIAGRFRAALVDYGAAGEALVADAAALVRDNVEDFLTNLGNDEPLSGRQAERLRLAAARRVHQGVSLESFLHAARIWGLGVWEAVRAEVGDSPAELGAALEISTILMRSVDLMSTVATHAYLREAQGLSDDGRLLPWDLLEALLGREPDPDRARRRAHMVGVRLGETYAALSISKTGPTIRWMVEAARRWLRPPSGPLLLGARDDEVVALYPLSDLAELHTAKEQAGALAVAVAASGASVGVSGWHPGLGGIALAYAEAKEAARIAAAGGVTGRAVSLDEVLIDHIARSTPHVGRILDETLHPLVEYDLRHGTALVATVRTYVESGFNLRRSAEVLHVHPNTVMYRLRRVRELCGRDPHDPDDLLMLFLAMKMAEVSPERDGAA
jgi:PucR C-terminal helix-turn-helix domain/GGDEF-like domain